MSTDYESLWDDSYDTPCENNGCGKTPCYTMRGTKALCNDCAEKMPSREKPILKCIFRETPGTPEGKYLIKSRDGKTVTKPSFVLLATDPRAADTLRHYAHLCERDGLHPGFVDSLRRWADTFDDFRETHGDSDPEKGRHRVDDPATIEEMKKGMSA